MYVCTGSSLRMTVEFKGNNNKALYTFLLLHIHEVYYYMLHLSVFKKYIKISICLKCYIKHG